MIYWFNEARNVEDIVQTILALPKLITFKPASAKEIADAEHELNLKFAKEYKEYLAKFGSVLADSLELTGIAKAKHRNVVSITKQEWEYNSKVPHTMYVIENASIDGIIIWQDGDGSVYKTSYDSKPEKIARCLTDYINKVIDNNKNTNDESTINEARNVEEYRAEKAAREKAEQDKKDSNRYNKSLSHGNYIKPVGTIDFYNRRHVGSSNSTSKNTKVAYRHPLFGVRVVPTTRHDPSKEDKEREKDVKKFTKRNDVKKDPEIRDAVNRNMRRHPERWDGDKPVKPKTESTIFDDVEIN